jgi:hypothetical protein
VRASLLLSTHVEPRACIAFSQRGGVCKSVALVPSPEGLLEQLLRLGSNLGRHT